MIVECLDAPLWGHCLSTSYFQYLLLNRGRNYYTRIAIILVAHQDSLIVDEEIGQLGVVAIIASKHRVD